MSWSLGTEFGVACDYGLNLGFGDPYQGVTHAYICIPWRMTAPDAQPYLWDDNDWRYKRCHRLTAETLLDTEGSNFAGNSRACVVEQDLSITKEKIYAINTVIRKLGVEVIANLEGLGRQMDDRNSKGQHEASEWRLKTSEDGKLWEPRVIVISEAAREKRFA